MKNFSKFGLVLLCIALIISFTAGCNGGETSLPESSGSTSESSGDIPKPLLEYTVLTVFEESPTLGYDNPDDVVTPVVEEKFNIKVKDILFSGGVGPVERVNMLVAAGTLPDVVIIDNPNLPVAYATGAFADLTSFKGKMVNTDIYVSDAGWNRLTVDGKLVAIPKDMSGGQIDLDNPDVAVKVNEDIFYRPSQNWALVVNEKILEQAGYTFKTVAQVQEELDANPRSITYDDVKIVPELKTIGDFEELIYKIKALDIKVDGKPLIPLSLPDWAAAHVSTLYSPTYGYYCNPETMDVTGFLFNPGMKDFYRNWKKWYDDGIVDSDYLIHKGEQFQEKSASGRVAIMMPGFDQNAVRQNLKEQGSDLRVIPWPVADFGSTYIDSSFPGGFGNIMINKNFKDIDRLLTYFDWFQSDEAKDLLTWGPESANLWSIKDGVKKLNDDSLWEAIRDGGKTADGKDAESFGINSTSKASKTAPGILYNDVSINRSYPVKFDAYNDMFNFVSTEKLNKDGTVIPPAGEKSNTASAYYWNTTRTTKIAELLSTKSDQEFDNVWEAILNDFKVNGEYEAAIEEMKPAFERALGK